MCGIAGIVDFNGRSIERDTLVGANATMRHRGPDDKGVWIHHAEGQSVGLAATRLAILDTGPAGHQPMLAEDGRYAIVFNGLIYNYRDLRDQLAAEGVASVTRCDTEIALWSCIRWGPAALDRFNGMWAMAFYDRKRRTGFLARDRFGIKPLLWAEHDGRLTFASEMRAIRRIGGWPDDLNTSALTHYLRFGYVAHPDTIYASARRLPPATYMPFSPSSVGDPVRYYTPPARAAGSAPVDPAEAAFRMRRALFESVARRRAADVPIGAFLSGGLDSSIIVAHLAQLSGERIKTFSVGWAERDAYDETKYARSVARRFDTEHYELKCRSADIVDLLPSMLDHLGEPFFDSSILPTAIVSHFARQHVTVALSGDGGDELFGGYWRYLAHGVFDRYRRLPRWLRTGVIERTISRCGVSKSSAVANRARQFRKLLRNASDDPFRRHIAWSEIIAPEARDLLRCDEHNDPVLDRLLQVTDGMDPADPMNRILAFDTQYSLPCDILHKVDLASMYHSIEVRIPFLDPEVVEAATALPSAMKVNGGDGKAILKDAYRTLLPEEVLSRTKKGFEVPIGEFLRNELREMFMDTVTKPRLDSIGIVEYSAVQRIYNEHLDRRGEHADLLYALLSLCWWRRNQR